MCCSTLLFEPPSEQSVDPRNGKPEPAVTGDGFAAKLQYEVKEGILFKRQAYIHEEDVGIMVFIGILDGIPYCHRIRVKGGIGLPFRSQVPQVSISF